MISGFNLISHQVPPTVLLSAGGTGKRLQEYLSIMQQKNAMTGQGPSSAKSVNRGLKLKLKIRAKNR